MARMQTWRGAAAIAAGLAACGPAAGEDGSSILADYSALSGGVVFATASPGNSRGYDLYWAEVPALQTVSPVLLFQLTNAGGNEVQPAVSPGGHGIAYSRPDEGIFFINTNGRIQRVSESGGRFKDSLPAVSFDGNFVAWVREDTDRPIGNTSFVETTIMLARNDGSDVREVLPRPGIVQDAPRFEPIAGSVRIAWSEFDPRSIGAFGIGPTEYGLWVHNFRDNVGQFTCRNPEFVVDNTVQRCFGQHLAWPRPNVLVVTQSFFEVYLDNTPYDQVITDVLSSAEGQVGGPLIETTAFGYSTFPLSASYLGDRMVFDGLVTNFEGSQNTLALWIASVDGSGAWQLNISGYGSDIDFNATNNYLFSVATPQLIP